MATSEDRIKEIDDKIGKVDINIQKNLVISGLDKHQSRTDVLAEASSEKSVLLLEKSALLIQDLTASVEKLSNSSNRLEIYTYKLIALTAVLIVLTIVLIYIPSDFPLWGKTMAILLATGMVAIKYRVSDIVTLKKYIKIFFKSYLVRFPQLMIMSFAFTLAATVAH